VRKAIIRPLSYERKRDHMISNINNYYGAQSYSNYGNYGAYDNFSYGGNNTPPPPPPPGSNFGGDSSFQGNEGINFSGNRVGRRMQDFRGQGQAGHGGSLTQAQRQEARELIESAREDGNISQEERAQIGQLFQSFRSENQSNNSRPPFGGGEGGPLSELSESQRSQIESLMESARSDGHVSAEERQNIHSTLESMVGHSLPEPGQQGPPRGQSAFSGQSGLFGSQSGLFGSQSGLSGYPSFQQLQGSLGNLQGLFQSFFG
ncbi:MAG: TerB family tellurite resistance protein, partial [Candidatus Eremiobacteraeota bacterium]|nr:TerB family tellurite resistance protein [Candidatus Eremiobacteraeota bacterium]